MTIEDRVSWKSNFENLDHFNFFPRTLPARDDLM